MGTYEILGKLLPRYDTYVECSARSMRRASVDTFAAPISDLEYRLSTDSTLDIFTMKPKV
jgi:hypothetical protein